jgi:dipeptidyl aminopeptidase/acylaminoacyl peptidase
MGFGNVWALLWIFLIGGIPTVHAQGSKADYERSKSLTQRVADRVTREQLQPHWREDGSFWYRVKTGPGSMFQWVDVNPVKGQKSVVISSMEIKKALEILSVNKPRGNVIDALEPIEDQNGFYSLRIGGLWWRWNKTAGELKPDESKKAKMKSSDPYRGPKASLRQGSETFITVINKSGGLAHLQWIDPDGKPKGYGHLQPGESRRQHTFGGHVWRVFDDKGNDLAWIEAEDEPTTVEIRDAGEKKNDEKSLSKPRSSMKSKGKSDLPSDFETRDFNIYIRNPDPMKTTELTTDGTEKEAYHGPFLKSPDGRYVIARKVRPEQKHTVTIVESSPKDQLQPKTIEFQYLKPGDTIEQSWPVLIDLQSKRSIAIDKSLMENPWSIGEYHWAEDSSEFYFLYNQRGHQVVRLVGLNLKNGTCRTVVEEKFDSFVDYTNKTWMHWIPETTQLLWMSERSGWNHLYLVDVASGKVLKPLTNGEWVVRKVEKIDEKNRQIWFYAGGMDPKQDPYHLHLARVNFDGSDFKVLTEGDGSHSVSFSPDGKYLIDRYSRVDLPPVHELRSAKDGKLIVKLEQSDSKLLESTGWSLPERFVAKGRDGLTDIYGVIYRPSNLDPKKKYPVVEEIYAGPHGAHVPKSWGLQMRQHQMAELGFIVVQIDGMGTNWRSKKFHDVAAKNLADAGFPDRKLWIKEAAKTRPWMDLNRVGIYGGSAGGQNAMRALIDHHDFYKVAVADCGCHDNRMDKIWWNEQWLGWPIGDQYEQNSNSAHAHKMQGKLLLIVGELDQNVDPASTMQVVDSLIRSDKDFDFLIVPGAGHGSAETPYGSRRRMDFLVRHLLGVEPRQN